MSVDIWPFINMCERYLRNSNEELNIEEMNNKINQSLIFFENVNPNTMSVRECREFADNAAICSCLMKSLQQKENSFPINYLQLYNRYRYFVTLFLDRARDNDEMIL